VVAGRQLPGQHDVYLPQHELRYGMWMAAHEAAQLNSLTQTLITQSM
jgi:hypothetical protein